MYRYKVSLWLNYNGTMKSKTTEVEFPKQRMSWTPNDPDKRLICRKAAAEIGEDPDAVDFNHSNTYCSYIGPVNKSKPTTSTPPPMSDEERRSIHNAKVAENRERREAKEAEMALKAQMEEKKRRLEMEEDRQRAELEAKERAERKQRADELRRQGKNFQAFMVEFQNAIIAVGAVLGMLILGGVIMIYSTNQTEEAKKINSQLEQIEDSVRIYINEGNYDRALVLTNQLVHPLNEVYEGKGTMWESEYYDQYWNKKREEYKNIILNKGTLDTQDSGGENAKKNNSEETPSADENSNTDIPQESEQAMPSVESEEQLDPEYQ
jgi:hypothetical protein